MWGIKEKRNQNDWISELSNLVDGGNINWDVGNVQIGRVGSGSDAEESVGLWILGSELRPD